MCTVNNSASQNLSNQINTGKVHIVFKVCIALLETGQEMADKVSNLIECSDMGRLLQKCIDRVNVLDCVKAYLSDFVYMVYHVTSDTEHTVKLFYIHYYFVLPKSPS